MKLSQLYEKYYFYFWWLLGAIPATIYIMSSDWPSKFSWYILLFYCLVLSTVVAFLFWVVVLFLGMIFYGFSDAVRHKSLKSAFGAIWLSLGLVAFLLGRCGHVE